MSKTFRDNYFEDDGLGKRKSQKSHKQKRNKVKDFLRNLDTNINEEDEFEIENLEELIE